jgi:hypothetical protein
MQKLADKQAKGLSQVVSVARSVTNLAYIVMVRYGPCLETLL